MLTLTKQTTDDLQADDVQCWKDAKAGKMPTSKRRFIVDLNEQDDIVLYKVGDTYAHDQQEVATIGEENFAEVVGGAISEWPEGVKNRVRESRATIRDFASQIKSLTEQNQQTQNSYVDGKVHRGESESRGA